MGDGLKAARTAANATRGILTKSERRALEWFLNVGEVALFGAGSPSSAVRNRLHRAGLTETCGREASGGAFAFTKFRISQAGRNALAPQ